MTIYLSEEAVSHLKDGIETIVIPVRNPHDMEALVFHSKRGGTYDVVEWLLSELGRPTELERVCGLTVTPQPNVVVVTLEMRQPGRQLEEWLKLYRELQLLAEAGDNLISAWDGDKVVGCLSTRAMSHDRFTDTHRPWWEKEIPLLPPEVTGEPIV